MTPYETEIIDLHVALEQWLGEGEGDINALLARFRPDFMMIPRVALIWIMRHWSASGKPAR